VEVRLIVSLSTDEVAKVVEVGNEDRAQSVSASTEFKIDGCNR